MPTIVTRCPSCEGDLQVSRLTCAACAMQIEGQFDLPRLLRLPPEDLELMVEFVCLSGSLKDLAKARGQSYPTIRNRLDEVIARLSETPSRAAKRRHEILEAIAKGRMTPKEGARRLKEIRE